MQGIFPPRDFSVDDRENMLSVEYYSKDFVHRLADRFRLSRILRNSQRGQRYILSDFVGLRDKKASTNNYLLPTDFCMASHIFRGKRIKPLREDMTR